MNKSYLLFSTLLTISSGLSCLSVVIPGVFDTEPAIAQTIQESQLVKADTLFAEGLEQFHQKKLPEALDLWEAALAIYQDPLIRAEFPNE